MPLKKPAPGRRKFAVDQEEAVERRAETRRDRGVVIVLGQAFQFREGGAPAGFEFGDAQQVALQALRFRPGGEQGGGCGLALDEFREAAFPPLGEVMDGAESGELQAAAVGFRDKVPERIAQRRRIGPAFKIGAVKKLHDRLADLAAARHDVVSWHWGCGASSGRALGTRRSSPPPRGPPHGRG